MIQLGGTGWPSAYGNRLQRVGQRAERWFCSREAAFPAMGPQTSITRPAKWATLGHRGLRAYGALRTAWTCQDWRVSHTKRNVLQGRLTLDDLRHYRAYGPRVALL